MGYIFNTIVTYPFNIHYSHTGVLHQSIGDPGLKWIACPLFGDFPVNILFHKLKPQFVPPQQQLPSNGDAASRRSVWLVAF